MRSQSSGTSGRARHPEGGQTQQKRSRIWGLAALAVLLPLAAVVAEGQETEPGQVEPKTTDPRKTYPGDSGLGPAAPWSVEGRPEPRGRRPKTRREREDDQVAELNRPDGRQSRRCKILEVEALGRLHVEDVSGHAGGLPYWVQLPPNVKLVAENPKQFDGRKWLKLEDLEVGQLLIITLKKKIDEILKVKVRAAKEPPPPPPPEESEESEESEEPPPST